MTRPSCEYTKIFYPVTVTLISEFGLLFKKFNLLNNFWTLSARALIFHMNMPCAKTFPWVPIFWTVSAKALIFHMSIPGDKTFPWVPTFMTLCPWSLTCLFKTLTFLVVFEQWGLELWYFTWIFLVTRPFHGNQHFLCIFLGILFLSCLSFCPPLWNFNLANTFWTVSARALKVHLSIPHAKTFLWVPTFFILWSWPWSLTHFLTTLTLLITFEQWVLELWYFTWIFPVIRPFCGYHYFLPLTLEFDPFIWQL